MHFGSLTRRARFEPGTLLRTEAAWRVTANGRFPARRSEPGVPAVDPKEKSPIGYSKPDSRPSSLGDGTEVALARRPARFGKPF